MNANVRYDGSNQFGERSNDKLLPIWSASFNYNVMEHFKGEQDWFDDLRLKMSYGYQGNMLDGQSPVAIISKKPYNDHYGEYVSSITTYPNPDLKWEKTGSLNGCGVFHVSASFNGGGLVLPEEDRGCLFEQGDFGSEWYDFLRGERGRDCE